MSANFAAIQPTSELAEADGAQSQNKTAHDLMHTKEPILPSNNITARGLKRALTGDVDPTLGTVPKQMKTARTPTESEGNEPVADTSEVMEVDVDSKDPAADQNKALVLFCGGRMEIEIYNPIKKALLGIGYLPFIRDDVKIDLAELLELADRDMIEFLKPREYANFYRQEILPAFANWQVFKEQPGFFLDRNADSFEVPWWTRHGGMVEEPVSPRPDIFPHQHLRCIFRLLDDINLHEKLSAPMQNLNKLLEEKLSKMEDMAKIYETMMEERDNTITLYKNAHETQVRDAEALTNAFDALQQRNQQLTETIGALRVVNIQLQTNLRAETRRREQYERRRRFRRRGFIEESDDDTEREELDDLFGPPGRRYL
ncbi:unnamed protein product [Caenorhabditis sp. 36 PRJEB53466]|nr:unnamed protein product [Caenorhabditis sp. 36 PRJEB53466]